MGRAVRNKHSRNSEASFSQLLWSVRVLGQPLDSSLLGGAACISERWAAEGRIGRKSGAFAVRARVGSPGSVGNPAIARGSHRRSGKFYWAEGHFAAGSCATSQGRICSSFSRGQLLGVDWWRGGREQGFPSQTLEVAASSSPLSAGG